MTLIIPEARPPSDSATKGMQSIPAVRQLSRAFGLCHPEGLGQECRWPGGGGGDDMSSTCNITAAWLPGSATTTWLPGIRTCFPSIATTTRLPGSRVCSPCNITISWLPGSKATGTWLPGCRAAATVRQSTSTSSRT